MTAPSTDTGLLLLEELLHGEGPACEWVGHSWDDGPTCSATVTHSMAQGCNGLGFLTCANGAAWARWVIGKVRAPMALCVDCGKACRDCWRVSPV